MKNVEKTNKMLKCGVNQCKLADGLLTSALELEVTESPLVKILKEYDCHIIQGYY